MEVLVDSPRRVRSIVAEPRGAHACVLFDDDGCELHCLLAKVPPNSLRSITAAVFVPPPPPAQSTPPATVVLCQGGRQPRSLLLAHAPAHPRSGFVLDSRLLLDKAESDDGTILTASDGRVCLCDAQGGVQLFAIDVSRVQGDGRGSTVSLRPMLRCAIGRACFSALLASTHFLVGVAGGVQVCPLRRSGGRGAPKLEWGEVDGDDDGERDDDGDGDGDGDGDSGTGSRAEERPPCGATLCELRGPEAAPISALWLVSQRRRAARALALDESGCLVLLQVGGGAPRLLRVALPFEPEPTLGCIAAGRLYMLDGSSALHVLPLSPLRADDDDDDTNERAAAEAASLEGDRPEQPEQPAGGAQDAGATSEARKTRATGLWRAEGPPALRATLTTLLPAKVHALAVLPAATAGAPPVALFAEPDGLRMLLLAGGA